MKKFFSLILLFVFLFLQIIVVEGLIIRKLDRNKNPQYEGAADFILGANNDESILYWSQPTVVHSGQVFFPKISLDPDDNIFVSWRTTGDNSDTLNTYISKSTDGGETFSDGILAATDTPWPHSQVVDADGNVYVAWSNDNVFVKRSSDFGESFADAIQVDDSSGTAYNYQMRPDMALDDAGNIYIVWSYYKSAPSAIYFSKSTDGGQTFSQMVRVDDHPPTLGSGAWSPSITVAPNGIIYAVWAHQIEGNSFNIAFTRSLDGGETFEPSRYLSELAGAPHNILEPQLEVFENELVYVVWHLSYNDTNNWDVFLSRSYDGGTSFYPPFRVNADPSISVLFPSISVGPEGLVAVSWVETAEENILTAFSTDQGSSFGTNSRVNLDNESGGDGFSYLEIDSQGTPHIIWQNSNWSINHSTASFSVSPFLDLPFEYDGSATSYVRALQDTDEFEGRVNTWFDHQYPNYTTANSGLWLYTGRLLFKNSYTIGTGNTCYERRCYDGHNGIDFTGEEGLKILSAADGTVEVVNLCGSPCSGYGNYVIVNHNNGYFTLYGHLKSINVGETTPIMQGEVLGIIGSTGRSGGTHLHFGVYKDNGNGMWDGENVDQVIDPFGWQGTITDPWTEVGGGSSSWLWIHDLTTQATFVGSDGAEITDTTGLIHADIPTGFFAGQVTIELTSGPVAGPTTPLRSAGQSFWLRLVESSDAANWASFDEAQIVQGESITLQASYTESNISHLDLEQMAFYFWDENLKLWEALPTSIDTINNIATTETFEFGEFDLQAPLLCPMDDFEPDDNYHHAVPIETNETPVNRVVDVYDDEDWFFFEAASGMDYILHTDNYGANVDITIDLFDQDGLTTLDTEKINDSEKEQVVKWQAFQDGTYFVRISRSTSSVFGCDATYRFMMTEVGDKLNYLPIILNSTD